VASVSPIPFERIGRPRHPDVLTPAEWEVLAGVREGLGNREIARARSCDVETVRFHLRNLRRKLAVTSRAELRAFPGRPAAQIERARTARSRRRIREQIPLIETADMARALEFYVSALGFEAVERWPENRELPGWVALAAGGARLMVRSGRRTRSSPMPGPSVVLSLYVEGVDLFRRDLAKAGYRCGEVRSLFYGAREFTVRDPDANEVAIVEFAASEPGYLASARRSKGGSR
jgi:DNA-binding CsgD family transcriptional regulator/uncharacterized glyoxalase superfamily protein PhnB